MKCQLEPLDFEDPDYDGITFTDDQKMMLMETFPNGVCDWSKPGLGQVAGRWATHSCRSAGVPAGPQATAMPSLVSVRGRAHDPHEK